MGSLASKFDALQAERERTWAPEVLRRNAEVRRALIEAFDPLETVQVGDEIAPFSLELSTGGTVSRDALTRDGPVALIFFRFGGCPACNIALPYYDTDLRPKLEARGIRLIAVSPHLPEHDLDEVRRRHALGFEVAADRDNRLGRRFGLTFVPHDDPPIPQNDPKWIGALTGTGTWELPKPAVIVIDRNHVVRFVDISPDWLRRTEPETVLSSIEARLAPRRRDVVNQSVRPSHFHAAARERDA